MKVTELKPKQKELNWNFLKNNEGLYTCVSEERPEVVFISLNRSGNKPNVIFVCNTKTNIFTEAIPWIKEKFAKMEKSLTLKFTNV